MEIEVGGSSGNVKRRLESLFYYSIVNAFPHLSEIEPLVALCTTDFGDYQCNNALSLKCDGTSYHNPRAVGQAILSHLPPSLIIQSSSIGGPGFVNLKLSPTWLAKSIEKMLIQGVGTWAPNLAVKRAVVDFSSPNIAKEMHVGHLRSTIIGDSISHILEFSNVQVLRRNHVGDWGTQFGMLIEHLFEKFPNVEDVNETAIGDLQDFYKESKKRFESDDAFKARARNAVVSLQGGEPKYKQAWVQICEISRKEFSKIYDRLGVYLEEMGESFYNAYIPHVIEELTNQGLVEVSDDARVIFIKGFKVPLIVVKQDGGYNYASTDLAALWYRLNEEKADWIIYVTDVGQQQHFDMVFSAAKLAGWLPNNADTYPRATHVGFGLVLGEDGKRFRTRSSEVVRLADLLDKAKSRMLKIAEEMQEERLKHGGIQWTEEQLELIAERVGYAAIKYADLKNNRLINYKFSFEQMLNYKGNTAVALLYAYARIRAILEKSGKDMLELKTTGSLELDHEDERKLGLHLMRFSEVVEEACWRLLPSILCDYLYILSEYFTKFYLNCKVIGSSQETSRLLLCEATATVMKKCFDLLGIEPLDQL